MQYSSASIWDLHANLRLETRRLVSLKDLPWRLKQRVQCSAAGSRSGDPVSGCVITIGQNACSLLDQASRKIVLPQEMTRKREGCCLPDGVSVGPHQRSAACIGIPCVRIKILHLDDKTGRGQAVPVDKDLHNNRVTRYELLDINLSHYDVSAVFGQQFRAPADRRRPQCYGAAAPPPAARRFLCLLAGTQKHLFECPVVSPGQRDATQGSERDSAIFCAKSLVCVLQRLVTQARRTVKSSSGGGASTWYGPDRPKFLGPFSDGSTPSYLVSAL